MLALNHRLHNINIVFTAKGHVGVELHANLNASVQAISLHE